MNATVSSILSLVFVLALIPASMWVVRRVQQGAGPSRNGPIDVRASVAVGPRERIAIVQAGGKSLLVGITAHTLTTLAEFDEPPVIESPVPSSFATMLKGIRKS